MESLKELYKIGPGPSSSHTLAPKRACDMFIAEYGTDIDRVVVELYGSLSLTGKGHYTDRIIESTFKDIHCEVIFKLEWPHDFPNGLLIKGFKNNEVVAEWPVYSLGGGSIKIVGRETNFSKQYYTEGNYKEIAAYVQSTDQSLLDYVLEKEPDILIHLDLVLEVMLNSVRRGLVGDGLLPGTLKVKRVARELYNNCLTMTNAEECHKLKIMSYAYAASEENAMGNEVVTAPTLGSCGVMASCCYYLFYDLKISKQKIIEGLAVAGIFGNIIKQNATISGAVGGCQAEIGVACAMASALISYTDDLSLNQIEYSAEMGIEHHLGLTCDPVGGYVIIPCIERNAVAALRSFDNSLLSKHLHPIKQNRISFDVVVNTMNFTGQKIAMELKETSLGGLAKEYEQ